jgi:hypothetical protein
MNPDKSRRLSYRRAIWARSNGKSLQQLLDEAHEKYRSTQDRVYDYGEGKIQGMSFVKRGIYSCGHISSFVPKQPACLVPDASAAIHLDTSTREPPEGHSYLGGDIFYVVKEDDLVICTSSVRETALLNYLASIISQYSEEFSPNDLAVSAVADVGKIQILKREGVARIVINSCLYSASIKYLDRKDRKQGFVEDIQSIVEAALMKSDQPDASKLYEESNLSMKVEISMDRRKKGLASQQSITETATSLLNAPNADDVTIFTNAGSRVRASNIAVSRSAALPAHGNSVSKLAAWQALIDYFLELSNSGVTSQ